ncbi:MAG: DUF2911 domain-containing protein [Ferruginibacter sp.]
MKKIFSIAVFATALLGSATVTAQTTAEKPKVVSPPATATGKSASGASISISYCQPSVRGRVIGKDVEPMDGKVWRTGANDATVFETDKDITVNGEKLAAGKYGFFTLFNGKEVTVIFNKTWKQWGAFKYDSTMDVLRIKTKLKTASPASEMMTFTIGEKGIVDILWGDRKVEFKLK